MNNIIGGGGVNIATGGGVVGTNGNGIGVNNIAAYGHNGDTRPPPPPHSSLLHMAGKWKINSC